MNTSTVSTTITDELAVALLTLLGAINEHNQEHGIISKEVAISLARVALEHYRESKNESKR